MTKIKQIWVIIGSYMESEYGYGGYTGKSDWIDEKIATFDTKQMALNYIKKAELKYKTKPSFNTHNTPRFRKKSLLRGFVYTSVEIYYPPTTPSHNPIL